MGASGWFESAAQDIRYAVRSLRGAPSFTAIRASRLEPVRALRSD